MVPFLVSDLTNSDHSKSWHILHCSVRGPIYNVIVMHRVTRIRMGIGKGAWSGMGKAIETETEGWRKIF